MGVLNQFSKLKKKVKASSLLEVLVATLIIMATLTISIVILNNLMSNAVKNSTKFVDTELQKLHYQYRQNLITFPYTSEENDWLISIEKEKNVKVPAVLFEAIHKTSQKKRSLKLLIYED